MNTSRDTEKTDFIREPFDSEKGRVCEMTDSEKIDAEAARILEIYRPAFLELAK